MATGSYQACFETQTALLGGDAAEACTPDAVTVHAGATSAMPSYRVPQRPSIIVPVRDAAGAPVEGVNVAALSACSGAGCAHEPVFSATQGVNVDASLVTDQTGSATLGQLGPGKYAICSSRR